MGEALGGGEKCQRTWVHFTFSKMFGRVCFVLFLSDGENKMHHRDHVQDLVCNLLYAGTPRENVI